MTDARRPTMMRMWRGRVPPERAREYIAYQIEVGPPGYRVIDGNQGIFVLGRHHGKHYEIAMLTLWKSRDAIRAFAGDPIDRAKYYDRDFDFLVDPPEKVEHYRVVASRPVSGTATAVRFSRRAVEPPRVEALLERKTDEHFHAPSRPTEHGGVYVLHRELDGRHQVGVLDFAKSAGVFDRDSDDERPAKDSVEIYDVLWTGNKK